MTWKVTQEGTFENVTKHNWIREFNGKSLICLEGNQRSDAVCTGCKGRVFASEILDAFGPPDHCGGLVAADMADGVHAGLFGVRSDETEFASTSH